MTRRLRIATIIDLAPYKLGSMEDSIVALVEEAARRGHKMDIFTFPPMHPIVAGRIEAADSRWINVKTLLAHPLASARRLGRGYDVVVVNLFAPRSLMARIAYAAIPARVVFVDGFSAMPAQSDRTSRARRLLDRLTPIRMAGLIAVSDYVLRRDMARFHVAPPFARRIYNGIDPQRFAPPPAGRPGPPTALAVASLIPEKGIHVLIDAFARIEVSEARLNIVGEGPERGRLEELARSRGLESRISFLGLRDDVDALLLRAHVFVHPCIWEEAFGYTLAEALATGCPVVASRIGSTPELVTDGETGLLVPPRDVSALAVAVGSVLRDSLFRERLGAKARRSATEQFSLEGSTNSHLDCYEEVAGG
ncbi:MAG: glycosyltransferase family 4 protein [Gemmatimonadota bacterium]|nr:glycosyltransferase family 4 protein [Gemmatimonadota bacterium]